MEKQKLKNLITEYGDAVVNYRSPNSKKLKYNVCTLDFSTPYIQAKNKKTKEAEDSLLVFCWDTNSFRNIKYSSVTSVVPLSAMLRNSRYG